MSQPEKKKGMKSFLSRISKSVKKNGELNKEEEAKPEVVKPELDLTELQKDMKPEQLLKELEPSQTRIKDVIKQKLEILGVYEKQENVVVEKYESIEKSQLNKMIAVNKALREDLPKFDETLKEVNQDYKQADALVIQISMSLKKKEARNKKHLNEVFKLENELKEQLAFREKLIDAVQDSKMHKDNVFRALNLVKKKTGEKLPKKVQEVAEGYLKNAGFVKSNYDNIKKQEMSIRIARLEENIERLKPQLRELTEKKKITTKRTLKRKSTFLPGI